MSGLFQQIKLFKALKLQPTSDEVVKIWEQEIEKYLISANNIIRCQILCNHIQSNISKEKDKVISVQRLRERRSEEDQSDKVISARTLRPRRNRKICKFCES